MRRTREDWTTVRGYWSVGLLAAVMAGSAWGQVAAGVQAQTAAGQPSILSGANLLLVRGIGFGLDERAMEAVSRYRFKPAMRDGEAVPCDMNIEATFQSYKQHSTRCSRRFVSYGFLSFELTA